MITHVFLMIAVITSNGLVFNISDMVSVSLRKNCPYLELFWSVFNPSVQKYGPEQLLIRTLFAQCLTFRNLQNVIRRTIQLKVFASYCKQMKKTLFACCRFLFQKDCLILLKAEKICQLETRFYNFIKNRKKAYLIQRFHRNSTHKKIFFPKFQLYLINAS